MDPAVSPRAPKVAHPVHRPPRCLASRFSERADSDVRREKLAMVASDVPVAATSMGPTDCTKAVASAQRDHAGGRMQ
jgi:hypothetical protein